MKQYVTAPGPIGLPPVEFRISDETARMKASRLMDRLVDFNDAENWFKGMHTLGFREEVSATRRWKAILRLPRTQNEHIAAWLDRKGEVMRRPDPKQTKRVMLVKLHADELTRNSGDGRENTGEQGLFLGATSFDRAAILYPERAQLQKLMEESTVICLKITFHSLQRLFQRGYELSEHGEVSYNRLLWCLLNVWLLGTKMFQASPEEEQVKVAYEGLRFVLRRRDSAFSEAPLDLITVLPGGGTSL